MSIWGKLFIFAVFIGSPLAIYVAARRHSARMRREGKWDENGPLKPTPEPRQYSLLYGGLVRAWERLHHAQPPRFKK